MKIETLDDLNLVSACCCPSGISCPSPSAETQLAHGIGSIYFFTTDSSTFYSRRRRSWSGGGEQIFEASPIHASQVGPVSGYSPSNTSVPAFQTTVTSTPPLTGSITDTNEGPIAPGDARAASKAGIFGGLDWATMGILQSGYPTAGRSPRHQYFEPDVALGFPDWDDLHTFRFSRFRWIVPNTFDGAYFKITWDVLEEPDGWDDPSPVVFRSFYAQDQTWEWAGPGDPGDADSWKSPWVEIPPPDVGGTRRVVNIRFVCFRAANLGEIPPVLMGEGVSADEL